jgi:hypothetical protein
VTQIDFDGTPAGTDITGSVIDGVGFELLNSGCQPYGPSIYRCGTQVSVPLIITTDAPLLPATSVPHLLSPGGADVTACLDPTRDNDDLSLVFTSPVRAFGLDVVFRYADGASYLGFRVLDPFGQILYEASFIPAPVVWGPGVQFVGFVSDSFNIARIEIDEYDEDCSGSGDLHDSNVGYDTLLVQAPCPGA